MAVQQTSSYRLTISGEDISQMPLISSGNGTGGNGKVPQNNDTNDNFADHRDLQLLETKLNSKIEISASKTENAINGLSNKIDFQSKLLWWIMGIISAGIIVPLITMTIKTLFFSK
nr:MAG TPA: hemolysin [Caudoviricetes sp.]